MTSRTSREWPYRILARFGSMVLVVGCLACTPTPLPDVPAPDLTDMEPQVVQLLEEGRETVLADPTSAVTWGDLGTLYDAHGLFEPAESCYREAVTLSPDDFRWGYLLAVVRETLGAGADEVVEGFGRAASLRSDYAPVHVRMGDALSTRGRYDEAAQAFRDAIAIAPDAAAAHRGLGQVLLALGEVDGAIEHLERAVKLLSVDRSAHAALAQAYLRAGRTEDAERTVQRSTVLQPVHSMEDPVYNELVLERSMSSSRVYGRAMGLLRRGEYAPAVADLEIVRAVRPDDASLHYWLGVAHRGLGDRAQALTAFTRSVELDGNLLRARLELARLLAENGQLEEAAEQGEQALRLAPRDPVARAGLAYAQMGRPDDAVRELELAVRISPGHPAADTLARVRGSSR
jgi:tetratricopeptide (TPR) repeat protein